MKSIVFVIFMTVHLAVALDDANCGVHEVMVECYSSCSPRTCPDAIEHPNGGSNRVCPALCETNKCDCENGYLRNECGVCVPATLCSQSCECESEDKEEIRCVNNCSVRSCDNIFGEKENSCKTDFCTKQCDCIKGYARNRFGECVIEKHCMELTE